jgi:hypothetical protein
MNSQPQFFQNFFFFFLSFFNPNFFTANMYFNKIEYIGGNAEINFPNAIKYKYRIDKNASEKVNLKKKNLKKKKFKRNLKNLFCRKSTINWIKDLSILKE